MLSFINFSVFEQRIGSDILYYLHIPYFKRGWNDITCRCLWLLVYSAQELFISIYSIYLAKTTRPALCWYNVYNILIHIYLADLFWHGSFGHINICEFFFINLTIKRGSNGYFLLPGLSAYLRRLRTCTVQTRDEESEKERERGRQRTKA